MKTIIGILLAVAALGTIQINTYALHEQNQTTQSQSITPLPLAGYGGPNQNETTAGTQTQTQTQNQTQTWSTYEDPILQFSIDYPSTWELDEGKDIVRFGVPDTDKETYSEFKVIAEPILTLDHSEYARDILGEERERLSGIIGVEEPSFKIIGLNETSIKGQPATMAQYKGGDSMYLSYFMVTNDYTGYRLSYDPDFREDIGNFTERLPMIERMANSFQITK